MDKPKQAFHGGAYFGAIGEDFAHLDQKASVVPADVLDAWYPPAPGALQQIRDNLEWLIRTSPPTHSEGLREFVASTRAIEPENILLGAGTSNLMFLTLPRLIDAGMKVLVFDPSYGEYAHIVENVIGAELLRFELPLDTFQPDVDKLIAVARDVDFVFIVNPNSPTGVALPRTELERVILSCPETKFWVDETYIDFYTLESGEDQSIERLVGAVDNLIVGKSMSKFYGLSGLRLGYLVAPRTYVSEWERFSPPWGVGMMAQLAGIEVLRDPDYYTERARETRIKRSELSSQLAQDGWRFVPSATNFVMAELPEANATELCAWLAERNVFIRNCNSLSQRFQDRYVRVAVVDDSYALAVKIGNFYEQV